MRKSCVQNVQKKAIQEIIDCFILNLGEVEGIEAMDSNTTIVRFISSDILIINVELISQLTDVGNVSLHTLAMDVILNGKKVMSEQFEGDEMILLRMCENLAYSVVHLIGGQYNGRIGKSAPQEVNV